MTRVAVIGTTGQLARCLAAADSSVERIFLGRDVLDLTKADSIAPALENAQPDLIVNAAAYTAVDAAETDRETAFAVNADGPGTVAQVAARLGVPFVHVSTDYVYDGTKNGAYVETDPVAPLGVYGASKRAGEEAVLAAKGRATILRTAWIYAPQGKNFVKTMLRLGATHKTLRIVADQIGSPTYAGDLADAILRITPRLIDAEVDCFDIFHCAGKGWTSWAGFAETIFARALQLDLIESAPEVEWISTTDYPTPASRPANSVLDCMKFMQVFGFALPYWQETLETALAAHPAAFPSAS